MTALPFGSSASPRSVWGCDQDVLPELYKRETTASQQHARSNGPNSCSQTEPADEPMYPENHYEYMPAVLLNSLKRDKKPFTYTPGRFDLSEVLNAKLQKRMEKKKKHLIERAMVRPAPSNELPVFEPPKQVLVMSTYNSPIDMYSMENALEALEVQAELTVADKRLSPKRTQTLPRNYKYEVPQDYEPKNVAQSKAFKVLQIITDTEGQGQEVVANNLSPHKEEMSFSGYGQDKVIPSKYFQTLQKMTGTDSNDTSNRMNQKPKGFESKGNQFQVESRFTGINQSSIPSKYFQNLQRMTAADNPHCTGNQDSRIYENNVGHFENEMRFTGTGQGNVIPSKYFQNLQRITGTDSKPAFPVINQQSRGESDTGKYNTSFTQGKGECNAVPAPVYAKQPGNIFSDRNSTSIPVLQRPAAFLPATQKVPLKKKTPRCVRFSAPESYHDHAPDTRPYEGTEF